MKIRVPEVIWHEKQVEVSDFKELVKEVRMIEGDMILYRAYWNGRGSLANMCEIPQAPWSWIPERELYITEIARDHIVEIYEYLKDNGAYLC